LIPFASPFYLAGGTALSLYFQHPLCADLDFFSREPFDPMLFWKQLQRQNIRMENVSFSEGTLHFSLFQVQVSFFEYDYPMVSKSSFLDSLRVASVEDIACMKLSAVLGRAEKKDYFDLAEILQHLEFRELQDAFQQKFGPEINFYPILKSMVFFEDVEDSPSPEKSTRTWEWVKETLVRVSERQLLE